MATKTIEISINVPISLSMIDRTKIKNDLKCWIGVEHSYRGIQGLQYTYRPGPGYEMYARETGGKVVSSTFGRRDIFIANLDGVFTAYVDVIEDSLKVVFSFEDGVSITPDEKELLSRRILDIVSQPEYAEFVSRQKRWFSEEPWKKVDGMTPQEAYDYLESEGW